MKKRWTMEAIAAMDTQFTTPTQAAQATGKDAYAINLLGKQGKRWMGLEVYFSGRKGTKAHLDRKDFLRRFGCEGGADHD